MHRTFKQTFGKPLAIAALGVAALAACGAAQAHGVSWSVGINLPPIGLFGGNAVYAPAPVYYPPPPVVYQAPPYGYAVPPQVVYRAPPVVYGPPVIIDRGWHGRDRDGWDHDHRRWDDRRGGDGRGGDGRGGHWHDGRYVR